MLRQARSPDNPRRRVPPAYTAIPLPEETWPQGLAFDDLDGDGDLDLIVALTSTDRVEIHLNQGNGTFVRSDALGVSTDDGRPEALATGDFNRDGTVDVAVLSASSWDGPFVAIWLNHGDGQLSEDSRISTPDGEPGSILVTDLNDDGRLDIAFSSYEPGAIYTTLNQEDGSFEEATALVVADSVGAHFSAGDFDDDNDTDLVTFLYRVRRNRHSPKR